MDQNLCNRREVHMGNAFTSDDFQKCLRKLEATGPLRIPPNVHNDGRSQAMRKVCGRISAYDEYVTWMLSENSQLLRLVWSSACGKTGLSEFLVEKLKQKTRDCPEATLACFFCDNQKFGGDTPAAILRSLLFQLLLQRTRLYQYIRADFEKGGAGGSFEDHLNDFSGLWRNLRDMLQDEQAGPVFIMIDALDACRGPARQDLLRSIRDLFHSLSSKTEAKVKLLITYTPDSLDIDKELGHVGAGLDLGERRTGANFAKNAWNVTENLSTAMIQDSYCKPLETTNHENYISTIESLLNRRAGIASKDNRYGRSPLSWAAESGQESMVKLLLDRGVDIECQDKLGQTPLSFAAKKGHEAVVRLLVCSGGRIDTRTGMVTLHSCALQKMGICLLWYFCLAMGREYNAKVTTARRQSL